MERQEVKNMETILYEKDQLNEITEALHQGGVIAFPTDTVYGVGVVYDNEEALQCLKVAKGREDSKPIPMMVSSIEQMESVAYLNDVAKTLAKNFMPGGFTLVCKKKETVKDYVTNGFETIAIRIPDDPFVLSLLNTLGKPMLVSSANLSHHDAACSHKEVLEQLNGRIHGVVKGNSRLSNASTIVDVSKDDIVCLREGVILFQDIKKKLEEN